MAFIHKYRLHFEPVNHYPQLPNEDNGRVLRPSTVNITRCFNSAQGTDGNTHSPHQIKCVKTFLRKVL